MNHQTHHNIVQKVTHQNNPHLKAQKKNHLQSNHQLNNLPQKKNLHRNKVRSLQLKVTLIVVVNLITNLIKNNSLTDNDVSLSIRLFIFYSVTLLSSTRFAILVIIGSRNGLAINPIKKKPRPKSPNIINFVIKISGTIPPTTSRKQSIKYVNGK